MPVPTLSPAAPSAPSAHPPSAPPSKNTTQICKRLYLEYTCGCKYLSPSCACCASQQQLKLQPTHCDSAWRFEDAVVRRRNFRFHCRACQLAPLERDVVVARERYLGLFGEYGMDWKEIEMEVLKEAYREVQKARGRMERWKGKVERCVGSLEGWERVGNEAREEGQGEDGKGNGDEER
ncbi:hypothetical protein K431DRAFT_283220 [Polychaeton citri CBS 116435]|uniref:Uncharacterized protein n=1 Tax=Polychaeton citri CBS 116435 TaxID=1314669 RepID=A0A9P4QDS5_9PEZI|nr:hypothetical protein K431DRAFT_283220 [Polychaeton citri CBS 116435]